MHWAQSPLAERFDHKLRRGASGEGVILRTDALFMDLVKVRTTMRLQTVTIISGQRAFVNPLGIFLYMVSVGGSRTMGDLFPAPLPALQVADQVALLVPHGAHEEVRVGLLVVEDLFLAGLEASPDRAEGGL